MKANYFKTSKIFLTAFIACLFLAATTSTFALGKEGDDSSKTASVTYLGLVNAKPVFQLNIDNATADDLIISLENTNGDVLYKKSVIDPKFSQKIQLNTTETDIELNLIVYSKTTKKSQVYYINKTTRTVEDLAIVEVKKY